ncbi:MAG: site-specific DNA-methyltransferase [Candidatus Angelobacter sp.]
MATQTEKLDLRSMSITDEQYARLKELFPEVFTEGGKIDLDRLKLTLGETVDVGKERYGMVWPGKADCFKTIQRSSVATLRPSREESVNFDTTENVIIEGDNLEVLKLLQKAYLGKIKMIYIDPPYNTGNDFIYPDNYTETLQTYLEYTGQVDAEGRKFSTNTEADGRFHSKWLNMMYPRLYLARNLLSEDGAVFVSIDDHEVHNLRNVMNEVFGEEAFVAQITVINNLKGRNDRKHIATAHESLLMYANPLFESNGLPLSKKQIAEYREKTDVGRAFQWRDLRKRGGADTRTARPKLYFPVYADPATGEVKLESMGSFTVEIYPKKSDGTDGCWRWGKIKVEQHLKELRATKVEGRDRWNVSYRVYLEQDGEARTSKPKSVWMGPEFSTDAATKALSSLIPEASTFTPKPVGLLKQIAQLCLEEGDICLDLFAGSGTTADAIFSLNADDGVERHFILIQLPEPTGNAQFPTIAEICKERCRRAIKALSTTADQVLPLQQRPTTDLGFAVFSLAESNFQTWNADPDLKDSSVLAKQLDLHVKSIHESRTSDDILFEILLKSGFPPTSQVKKVTIEEQTIYSAAEGELLICLEKELTSALLGAMAGLKPWRVVCLDEGFAGNDQLKTNAVQSMKAKGVTSFRTV